MLAKSSKLHAMFGVQTQYGSAEVLLCLHLSSSSMSGLSFEVLFTQAVWSWMLGFNNQRRRGGRGKWTASEIMSHRCVDFKMGFVMTHTFQRITSVQNKRSHE